jgi:hypothetical protein
MGRGLVTVLTDVSMIHIAAPMLVTLEHCHFHHQEDREGKPDEQSRELSLVVHQQLEPDF